MRNRPCLLFMCMFLPGILCVFTKTVWMCVPAVLLFLYVAPWKEQGLRRVLFATVLPFLFLCGIIHTKHEIMFREKYLKELDDGKEVTLAGKIERIEPKTKCYYYYLTDCTIRLSNKQMRTNDVISYVSSNDYSIGQILVIQGKISLFEQAANEGNFDAKSFYQSQKIDFGLWADKVKKVYGKGSMFKRWLFRMRKRLQKVLDDSDQDGVLSAMLLGEKSSLDGEIKTLYQRAGIAHILAISGLHVSLLGMGIYRMLRRRGMSYTLSTAVTAVFMISYAVMTGNSVSAKRAIGMLLIYLLADMLGYGYDLLSALGAVVIFLLWENPFLIGYSGFLFSVMAVLGVGIGGNIINEYRKLYHDSQQDEKEGRMKKFWQNQKDGLGVSLGIQLFTLPLVAYNYYEIPVYAMLLNLFVLALVSYLLLFAVCGSPAGICFPEAGKFLLVPCGWILGFYEKLCSFFLSLPGAVYVCGKPGAGKLAAWYIILAVGMFIMWIYTQKILSQRGLQNELSMENSGCIERKRFLPHTVFRKQIIFPGLAAVLMLMILFFPSKKDFEIDILNVGQGDGIYLCTSDGISMFIDGGSTDIGKVGIYRILSFLKSRGIKKISYWFVSHTDADHISGLEEILSEGYQVEHLVFSKASAEDEKTKEICKLAVKNKTEILYMSGGNVLHIGQAKISCLYPGKSSTETDINDRCLTLQLKDDGISGFFGGDISTEIEKKLVSSGVCSHVDFFKANHHGSRYSNGESFLEIISPKITAASAGENNRYGHPAPDAVERIKKSGSIFYCTADDGQVKLKKYKDGLTRVK